MRDFSVKQPLKSALNILRNFFFFPDTALNLAMFRITVLLIALFKIDETSIIALLRSAPGLREIQYDMVWLSPSLELSPQFAHVAVWILRICCVSGILGFMTGISTLVVAALSLMLFSIENFFGKVIHDTQTLIWFLMVVAACPSGDALSIDELIRRKRNPGVERVNRSSVYGLPIRITWFLYGVLYLFPGIHKIVSGGWEWVFSDNITNLLFNRWYWGGGVPARVIRFEHVPYLPQLFAAAVIVFEVGFIFAIFIRSWRWLFVVSGVVFHTVNFVYLRFPFYPLRFSYTVFVNWSYLFERLRLIPQRPLSTARAIPPSRSNFPMIIMGSFLIFINSLYGVLDLASWPFTAFPSFSRLYWSPFQRDVEFELQDANGNVLESKAAVKALILKINITGWHNRVTQKILGPDEAKAREDLKGIFMGLREMDPKLACATKLICYFTRNSTVPERRAQNPFYRELGYTITAAPSQDCQKH